MTMHIVVFLQCSYGETLQYLQFSFICQEVNKVVCQHILVSMLTVCVMPVSPQLIIMLLPKLNLVKKAVYSHVHGYVG